MRQLTKKLLLLSVISVLIVGCRPEEEATSFGMFRGVESQNADSILMDNICSVAPDQELSNEENINACESQEGCQAVYDTDGSRYLGCAPITPVELEPTPTTEPVVVVTEEEEPAPAPEVVEEEPAPAPAPEVVEEEPAPAPAPEVVEEEPAPAPTPEVVEEEPAPAPAPVVTEEVTTPEVVEDPAPTNNEIVYCDNQVDGNLNRGKSKAKNNEVSLDENSKELALICSNGISQCLPAVAAINKVSSGVAKYGACSASELKHK